MSRSVVTKAMVTAVIAVSGASLAACGSSPSAAPSPASTSASAPVAAATPAGPATPAATAAPTASPAATFGSLWCGSDPQVPAASFTAWLAGPGYTAIQDVEGTLSEIRAANVPAATVQALSASLCSAVAGSEATPPSVDLADYTTAMDDFVKASVILHANPEASGLAEAGPDFSAGETAFNTFLAAIGRPA
jgi:hypothetical protein